MKLTTERIPGLTTPEKTLQVGRSARLQDLEGEEDWSGEEPSSPACSYRTWPGRLWPDSGVGLEAPQNVRLDPENDGEITDGFQVGKRNQSGYSVRPERMGILVGGIKCLIF